MLAGHDTTRILGFLLGHTSDSSWTKVALLFPTLLIGLAFLYLRSRRLNALAVGEASAQRLGVDVNRLTNEILLIGTAMTAAAVGAVGIVGFIGLVAPHLARRLFGVDWRVSLPGSALMGTVVLLAADLIGQRALSEIMHRPGMEVNVGIVSALLGAPSLLILLRRSE
jgi:iron complex transport system permease protein